jgi:hypothetical protein
LQRKIAYQVRQQQVQQQPYIHCFVPFFNISFSKSSVSNLFSARWMAVHPTAFTCWFTVGGSNDSIWATFF